MYIKNIIHITLLLPDMMHYITWCMQIPQKYDDHSQTTEKFT